jgi:hypothetical protein
VNRTTPFAAIAAEVNKDAAGRARSEEQKRAMDDALALQSLRDRLHQADAGANRTLNLTEADEAAANRPDDLYLTTLQHYISEMGGRLLVEAVFPDIRVNLLRSSGTFPTSSDTDPTDAFASSARTA